MARPTGWSDLSTREHARTHRPSPAWSADGGAPLVWARPVCGARAGGEASGLTQRRCLLLALWDGDYRAPSSRCLSTLLLPGAPSSFWKSRFSALLQNTSMSWMGALTHVCCPGFCCCPQSHFSMAWLWWAVGLPLAVPQGYLQQRKSS